MSGLSFRCLRFVPGRCFLRAPEGSTTSKVMDAVHPDPVPVTVIEAALSGAVNVTVVPLFEERLPPPELQLALPSENVTLTSSPTPILVRARFAGCVATVSEVIENVFGHGGEPPLAEEPPALPLGPLAGWGAGFAGTAHFKLLLSPLGQDCGLQAGETWNRAPRFGPRA